MQIEDARDLGKGISRGAAANRYPRNLEDLVEVGPVEPLDPGRYPLYGQVRFHPDVQVQPLNDQDSQSTTSEDPIPSLLSQYKAVIFFIIVYPPIVALLLFVVFPESITQFQFPLIVRLVAALEVLTLLVVGDRLLSRALRQSSQ